MDITKEKDVTVEYIYRWSFKARNGRVIRSKNGHPFRIPVK